jgi:hypothetical protein|tara:strand:+ start:26 stop:2461 length:2436 start_codon:yes stop_codon:yes gene_type:complete
MSVDKAYLPFVTEETDTEEIEIEIVNPDAVSIDEGDGSTTIIFDEQMQEEIVGPDHDSNYADFIDDGDLQALGSELVSSYENDVQSRKDWSRAYVKGLDLLGLKIEERDQPWMGACGVYHPILTEAVVRFQAQAITEIFPASGPVRTQILGVIDPKKSKQASRVEDELNYLLTEKMTEYRDEFEQLLFKLPLAGSAFKKVYFDPISEKPVAMFVPAEDFVVEYGASDLESCPRFTHVMKKTTNEIRKLMLSGFYSDIELSDPSFELNDITRKENELDGESAFNTEDDDRYTLLEMHVDINLPEPFEDPDEIARPYIITISKTGNKILSIRRNWYEDDPRKEKRMHFTHYRYLPGLGFYGTGLIHLMGGLAKSATSILRQLVDAGTLSNLPAGLKARGLRVKGNDSPLTPGEFRDVDIPGGAIKDNIYMLPYKEPSQVLYSLLTNIVEEGRRIGSVADIDISSTNANAPVGTTLALLERSMKVMSGVQARLHASLRKELKLISNIVHDFMPETYDYMEDVSVSRKQDFDGRVDVIPVSDPNAATMSQKVIQYQAALQLAQQAPQLYDLGLLHRQMLEVLGIKDADKIIELPDEVKPYDPVTENMRVLKQEAIKAFSYQDHEAHIQVHMAFTNDPKIREMVGQSPFASAIQGAMSEHIAEHIALQYRKEIELQLGAPLPDPNEPLPEDLEYQLSSTIVKAADKLLKKDQAEAAQKKKNEEDQNPLNIIQRKELEIKETELKHKMRVDMMKIQADNLSKDKTIAVEKERIDSEERKEGARLGVKIAADNATLESKESIEGLKAGIDMMKNTIDR